MKKILATVVLGCAVCGTAEALTIKTVTTPAGERRWFEDMVPLSDGVKLYTYGVVPEKGMKVPIIIERTPYAKEIPVEHPPLHLWNGYAMVKQHCRGSGMSEGNRIPYDQERKDGLEFLEFVRKLPWYGGEIYLNGGSYLSTVHWCYLDTDPADVKGACLTVQDLNGYNISYRNGFFKSALHGGWFLSEYYKKDKALPRNRQVSLRDFPLIDFSMRHWGSKVPSFDNVICHPTPEDPYWRSDAPGSCAAMRKALLKSTKPVLLKTGFYDIYTEGVFDMWREMPLERRANCALIVDAYDHGGTMKKNMKGTKGEFPGGAREDEKVSPVMWFDAVRKGATCAGAERGMTKYFALWENAWHVEPELKDGPRPVELKLGDGEHTYAYDPRKAPPPFPGSGGTCFGGMQVQPSLKGRTDAVTFLLPPIAERLDVRGRMEVKLAVRSDCEDTAFYVRVSVDKGEGKFYLLRDDITSLSYAAAHHSLNSQPSTLNSQPSTISFRFPDHAFRLERGDVLRVDVASASPHYAPHANVRGDQFAIREPRVAHNTVLAGESKLILHTLEH